MLFKFIESDGNEAKSVAKIRWCGKDGREADFESQISLTILVESCAKLPHFRGFLPGQMFEIDVRPVAVKPPETIAAIRPVTDGGGLLPSHFDHPACETEPSNGDDFVGGA